MCAVARMQVRSPCRAGGPKPARGPRRHHPTDLPSGEPEHHLPLPLSSTPTSPTSPPLPRPPSRSHNVTSPGCSRPHPPTKHRPLRAIALRPPDIARAAGVDHGVARRAAGPGRPRRPAGARAPRRPAAKRARRAPSVGCMHSLV